MKTLYRAICFCTDSQYRGFDEKYVFFETVDNEQAGERLQAMLSDIWAVPESAVGVCNVYSEKNLLLDSLDDSPGRGDKVLFENGWDKEKKSVQYLPYNDWPLMLVSPRTHERLLKAFLSLNERNVEMVNHG
ncbi:hypothetical protein [Brenneria izbisi]|uniref:Uncharacterized protein n=1 Tax=Brenneria izbisi TaxID=2939450 RepID=A0AA41XYZ3_9GAMM|nr:hypothetical protein [Brenneria izbisi]MCV9879302.1 hypothetical protein [Brenneria izbisi]MCV9883862.1 hypothetical protein [Brenneria izbisi]